MKVFGAQSGDAQPPAWMKVAVGLMAVLVLVSLTMSVAALQKSTGPAGLKQSEDLEERIAGLEEDSVKGVTEIIDLKKANLALRLDHNRQEANLTELRAKIEVLERATSTPVEVAGAEAPPAPPIRQVEETKPAKKGMTDDEIDAELKKLGCSRVGKTCFAYKDVKMEPVGNFQKVIGVMLNFGNNDFKVASFTLNVVDKKGKLLATSAIPVSNLKSYEPKTFSAILTVDVEKIGGYSIQFENGF